MKINKLISWGHQLQGDPLQVEVSNNYNFARIRVIMPFLHLLSQKTKPVTSWIKIIHSKSNAIHPLHSGQYATAVQTLPNLYNFLKMKSRS